MPLLTQFSSFFISPFGEMSVCDELNLLLRSHRIVNAGNALSMVSGGPAGCSWWKMGLRSRLNPRPLLVVNDLRETMSVFAGADAQWWEPAP